MISLYYLRFAILIILKCELSDVYMAYRLFLLYFRGHPGVLGYRYFVLFDEVRHGQTV